MLSRSNLGDVANDPTGGIPVNPPWYCPVPGTPANYLQKWLGCSTAVYMPYGSPTDPTYPNPTVVPVQSVDAGTSTTPAPYECKPGDTTHPDCPGYDAAIAAVIAKQQADQQAANAATMAQAAANIKAAEQARCPTQVLVQLSDGTWSCPNAISLTTKLLLVGGGLVAVMLLSRR